MLSESRRTDKQGIKKGPLARPFSELVGTIGFEPTTPTMSRWCSNQLSYVPPMDAHSRDTPDRVKQFFANSLIFVIIGSRGAPLQGYGITLVSRDSIAVKYSEQSKQYVKHALSLLLLRSKRKPSPCPRSIG